SLRRRDLYQRLRKRSHPARVALGWSHERRGGGAWRRHDRVCGSSRRAFARVRLGRPHAAAFDRELCAIPALVVQHKGSDWFTRGCATTVLVRAAPWLATHTARRHSTPKYM